MSATPHPVAPFFSLARAACIQYAITWDADIGAFRGVDGPRGFASYREAVGASRFLRPPGIDREFTDK